MHHLRALRTGTAVAALTVAGALLTATPAVADQNTDPDFGPNVFVADPSMSDATIAARLTSLNQVAQFGDGRNAVLFKPGTYGQSSVATGGLNAQVGYYTSIAGLGASPDDVTIVGGLQAEGQLSGPSSDNATTNFWRSLENLAIKPLAPNKNNDTSRALHWAVSQGASLRRVDVQGNLQLFPTYGGYSSGGFLADTRVRGVNGVAPKTTSGSQQQWYSRDSDLGAWSGAVWNMVFSGVTGAPADSPSTGTPPKTNVTTLASTPVSRGKPYLYVDGGGSWHVMVPAVQHDSAGVDWNRPGVSLPLSDFYLAKPGDSADTIDAQLAAGKDLVFTPGIYPLEHAIHVTRPDTVVLGMGYATLRPQNGAAAIETADVDGVSVSGLIIDAGATTSPTLLRLGTPGSHTDHSADPSWLSDLTFRIGGAVAGSATTSLAVESDDALLDNIWAWRADHGNGVGWSQNTADTGLVVDGDGVTALGLAVEHYQKNQVVWNGDGGTTVFYQSEEPYDVPDQASWMDGSRNGYASYRVADGVTDHRALGLGVYAYFTAGPAIVLDSAIQTPRNARVTFHHSVTVRLGGAGQIGAIVNDAGATASSATAVYLPDYPPADVTPPTPTLAATPASPGASGWYTSPVVLTATATDDYTPPPAVALTVDGAPTASPATVGDGVHTATVTATDAAGNTATAPWSGRVDTAAPVTTAAVSGGTVTLTADDATSGVATTEYAIGSAAAWTAYTAPFPATGTVRYRSQDVAGNVEEARTLTVPGPALTLDHDRAAPGDALAVHGSGIPDGDYTLVLHSAPIGLGAVTASGGGFDTVVTLPAAAAVGAHTVQLVDADGTTVASAALTVVAAGGDPVDPVAPVDPAAPASAALAATGSGTLTGPATAAALLAMLGALALLTARRRRSFRSSF